MAILASTPVTQKFLLKRAKQLQIGWTQTGGRNSSGTITSYKKGSFKYKRIYRFIDFWRRLSSDAYIISIEKDSFRTCTISLVLYQTGVLTYIVLPSAYKVGDKLPGFNKSELTTLGGAASALRNISDGVVVFNIELWPTKGAQVCRAAGTYAMVVSRHKNFVTLKLRSGWNIVISDLCMATIGLSPNYEQTYKVLRKAGLRVNLGRRPTTRGVAMNAIDHPHGGGRGKTSGGRKPRSPWGAITKQRKTVLKKIRTARLSVRFK